MLGQADYEGLLHDDRDHDEEEEAHGHEEDDGVESVESTPRGARDGVESIDHGDVAIIRHNSGLDAALVRAVEGDDGINVERQQRGLDADQHGLSGHN